VSRLGRIPWISFSHETGAGHRARPRKSLIVAGLALTLAWLTVPGVPLYDGVGFPDEPYRYVQPPPGYRFTQPPTSVTVHVTAASGVSNEFFNAPSKESGPQVEVLATKGGLVGAPNVRGFDVKVTPVAPGPATPGTRIEGNLYHVTVSSEPPGPVTVARATSQVRVFMRLRATSSKPGAVTFVYRASPADPWKTEPIQKAGNDVFMANVVGPGDYALAAAKTTAAQGTTTRSSSSGGIPLTVIVLAATLAIIVVAVVATRIARRRTG
jgi:hypothetical protein